MLHYVRLAIVIFLGSLSNLGMSDERMAQMFLKAHCIECHGAEIQEGGLRLDSLAADFTSPASFASWVKIHDRLHDGEMPPKDSPQPSTEERTTLIDWFRVQLVEADKAQRRFEGRAVFRRLNRTEYEHTLRDLLDVPGFAIRDLLPEDGRVHGYDKSGDGLELSHVQMAKYMEAADLALAMATTAQIDKPEVFPIHLYPSNSGTFRSVLGNGDAVFLKNFKVDESIIAIPGEIDKTQDVKNSLKTLDKNALDEYEVSVGIFRHEDDAFRPTLGGFEAAYAGMYRLRISLWSFQWDKGQVLPATKTHAASLLAMIPKAGGRILNYFDAPSLDPTTHEIVVWLNPGERIGFNAASLPHVRVSERKGRAAEWVGPGIAVDWFEIDGPLLERWPTSSHHRLFGELTLDYMEKDSLLRIPDRPIIKGRGTVKPKSPKKLGPWTVVSTQPKIDAERLLKSFLHRAFRRPVSPEEIARYCQIVEQMLAENLTFEDALGWAYKTALCSPEFLFIAEQPGPLNDWALASRLSYFLWNSTPDESLMLLADQGKLHDSAVLQAQVERMLADAKAERFVEDFVDQWLDLHEIDLTTPDKKLYPEFTPYLRDSMLRETRAFFRELLDHDLSVLNFVDSEFAILNQRMAEHYGISGIEGTQFRKVKLPSDCHRGGVLTHASVLKVTANGTTTTPVKRGAWVLREIIGKPPLPPPPNIPAIEPDVQGTTTIREQIDKHRSSQICAACHAKIDPPGFALESYDVIGGWRTQYRSLGEGDPAKSIDGLNVSYRLGPLVDPSGKLKDGRQFADIDEFQRLLLTDPDRIARNIIEQLLVYATGSEISFADRAVVDDILNRTRRSQHGLRSIVLEVVQSRLFLEK